MKPKYQQIIETLKKEINSGRYHTGDRFYSEADIKDMFKVSSTTAVKVLNLLASANLINRIQGKGTFIAAEKHNTEIRFTDLNMSRGAIEGTKVIAMKKEKQPAILHELNLGSKENYYTITRLRYIGSQISELAISHVNSKYIKNFDPHHLQKYSDIYRQIQADFSFDPFKLAYKQVATAEVIDDPHFLKLFNSEKPLPVIKQSRHTYLSEDRKKILDFVNSYKLLKYWGFRIEVPAQN